MVTRMSGSNRKKKVMERISATSSIKKRKGKGGHGKGRRHEKAPAQDLEKAAKESDTDFDEVAAVGRISQETGLAEEPDTDVDRDTHYHFVLEMNRAAEDFEIDFEKMQSKMPRFPASLKGVGTSYVAPRVVAIGPYHNPLYSLGNGKSNYLVEMEEVKRVAASHFIKKSGHSFLEIRAKVESVASDPHKFYNIGSESLPDFVSMMCVDGCFLLQYMLICTARDELPSSLLYFFESNQAYISNDIMLLENQLPWVVLHTLWSLRPSVNVGEFIGKMGRTLQVSGDKVSEPFAWDGTNEPPHLLGLLWLYKTGGSVNAEPQSEELRPMSKTISAIELAEMGIKLTASKTTKFTDMGIKRRPVLADKIFLAPLLLDEVRSCWLVNMAAFEVSMAKGIQNPIVCSYLAVLAMLMDREEDVHKLRSKRLVQGELTNKETLDFFKAIIKHISGGPLYINILEEIESYKSKRWFWIKVHKFVYKNIKTIVTVVSIALSIFALLVALFKVLLSIKEH
ncbi:UPF0481 protein At3g47200-like [Hordeum vulgare subsp. vulgare]|uniref:Uncharacterized protein n=1 Tax=Hordeum vulgare subsp. vulgare TaxID=112509 RepID=M0X5X2_HORVV|nr:UPF0481 protein At3g47200-like [Hordeum vulgare subsp. vulgare]